MRKRKALRKQIWKKATSVVLLTSMLCTGWLNGEVPVLATTTENIEDIVVVQAATTTSKVKNIIYMIPDGGGFPSYDIAKKVKAAGGLTYLYQDDFTGTEPTSTEMYLDDYLVGTMTTRSADNDVTDSAAAGTALATGQKTNNDYVGLDTNGKPLANILELCQLEQMATGLIVTTYTVDATPGGFSSHSLSRSGKNDILKQMANQGMNVVIGGGSNKRVGDNAIQVVKDKGYNVVTTENALQQAAQESYTDASTQVKVWGEYATNYYQMPYEVGYNNSGYDGISSSNVPTLAEMTKYSIDLLSQDEDGFFLMIEGSKIDYSNHHREMRESVGEWIAFDEAFKVALDFAKEREDTVIVVVPDHNTGLDATPSDDNIKTVVNLVQNGESTKSRTDLLDFASYSADAESPHTSMDVGVWMYLPEGVSSMSGVSENALTSSNRTDSNYKVDNTAIAPYLASLVSEKTLEEATGELYVDVTSKGTYSDGVFTLSELNAKIPVNTDTVIKDNNTMSFDGKISVYVNEHMYVPLALMQACDSGFTGEDVSKIEGSGTVTDPYIIDTEVKFQTFTNNLKAGQTYENQYFKQTVNLDMTKVSNYVGIGSEATFSGTYDGQGYTIHVDISNSATNGIAIFPYTDGTICNLGTTGSIENTYESEGGCAGIVRSMRSGGKIYNCWSTVDLTATKDVGGIAWTIKEGASMYNCYYKGCVSATNNYGIGILAGTVENCFYQMEEGSASIYSGSSNQPSGQPTTDFSATALNSYRSTLVSELGVSEDSICQFVDVDGNEFAFAASVAKLESLTYQYTDTQGKVKTGTVENFDPNVSGYSVMLGADMDASKVVTVGGTAMDTGGAATITEGSVYLDSKGCGSAAAVVEAVASTSSYETRSSARYSIIFSGPAGNGGVSDVTVTPIATITVTEAPKVTKEPTKTPTVTTTPEATKEPTVTEAPRVTEKPTEIPKATITITETPKMTEIPSITPSEKLTVTPEPTGVTVTVAPEVTVTETPTVTPAKQLTITPKPTGVTEVPEVTVTEAPSITPVEKLTVTPEPTGVTEVPEVTVTEAPGKLNMTPTVAPTTKPISIGKCTVLNYKKSYTYNRKAIAPKAYVIAGNKVLVKNVDYTITYKNNKKVGTAKMVIKGKGNYVGSKTVTYKIKAKSISSLKVEKIKAKAYTGKAIKPAVTLKYGNYKLKKNTDYTVKYKKNKKKGTAQIIVKGKGNYKGSRIVKFKIK